MPSPPELGLSAGGCDSMSQIAGRAGQRLRWDRISFHREAHVLKSICAVVVAVVAWFLTAVVGNLLIRAVLPGYTEVEADMNFTFPMKLCRLALALVASICTGCSARRLQVRTATRPRSLGVAYCSSFSRCTTRFGLSSRCGTTSSFSSLAPAVLLGSALYSQLASPKPRAAAQPDAA